MWVLLKYEIWHIFIYFITFWVWKCRILPQQIVTATLNVCEQIVLWKRNGRLQEHFTSASLLCLKTGLTSLHYTFSKTYPLFMSHILILLALLCHPPKYLCVSYQRSKSSRSGFVCVRGNELGLRKYCSGGPSDWTKLDLWGDYITVHHKTLDPGTSGHGRTFTFHSPECLCWWTTKANTQAHTEIHNTPPVWVGGVATQQLSGAAYGVSNWVEQHSWRTRVQDLASGNQSHNPQLSSFMMLRETLRWVKIVGWVLIHWAGFVACSPFWFQVRLIAFVSHFNNRESQQKFTFYSISLIIFVQQGRKS